MLKSPIFPSPSAVAEYEEQVASFFRRSNSKAEGEAALLSHSASLLAQLGDLLPTIRECPAYAGIAFYGRLQAVDIKLIRRLPDLLEPQGHVLLCLNAPELDTDFLHRQVSEAAPGLRFVERLANPAAFVDVDPEKALKVLHYQNA